MADAADLETWENKGKATVVLQRFDGRGGIHHETILGGRKLHIAPEERRRNQEIAADDTLDPFKNGMLVPVRLIAEEEDTPVLQANVNAMSETAMKALFKSQLPTFRNKVKEISNVLTLDRLLEVASAVDASIKQVEVIQERRDALSPAIDEIKTQPGEAPAPRAVTPK